MLTRKPRRWMVLFGSATIMVAASSTTILRGDEPGRLGRLFRGPSASRPNNPPAVGKSSTTTPSSPFYDPLTNKSENTRSLSTPITNPGYSTSAAAGHTGTASGTGTKLVAQPKVSNSVTEADPMVTRISIGRADDGKQFCMFVQVFADGTVMDSEGIHKVGADSLRPIAQVLQTGDLARLKGHCGGPASDFIEQVHVVAYDRYLGRLRAHSFSYSGNPEGCDESVKQLNAAIDALQAKMAGPPSTAPAVTAPAISNAKPIGLTPAY